MFDWPIDWQQTRQWTRLNRYSQDGTFANHVYASVKDSDRSVGEHILS